jgi:hypothetical protein
MIDLDGETRQIIVELDDRERLIEEGTWRLWLVSGNKTTSSAEGYE